MNRNPVLQARKIARRIRRKSFGITRSIAKRFESLVAVPQARMSFYNGHATHPGHFKANQRKERALSCRRAMPPQAR